MIYIESDVKEFIRRLPELSQDPPTVHLAMLAVRSKKAKELLHTKIKDLVVERDIIRADSFWRRRYFSKIHNLAALQHCGFYDLKETVEIPRVPPEAMGIMATITPRNVFFAVKDIMSENIGYLYERVAASYMELAKESSRYFGFLHRHKQKGYNYVTLDIDTLDEQIFRDVNSRASGFKKFMVTETSGGYHIVLDIVDQQSAVDFYKGGGVWDKIHDLYKDVPVELQRDSQEPVPGTLYCRKGGEHYFVRFIE